MPNLLYLLPVTDSEIMSCLGKMKISQLSSKYAKLLGQLFVLVNVCKYPLDVEVKDIMGEQNWQ